MAQPRIGIWFIGARGGVAATATLGLLALQKKLASSVGLVSELPQFAKLDLATGDSFVVGGHEIRDSTLQESIDRLRRESRVFDAQLVDSCRPHLAAIDRRIRSGSLIGCGQAIGELAGKSAVLNESPWESVRRLQADLQEFRTTSRLDRVVVVNLASTEPPADQSRLPLRWDDLSQLLDDKSAGPLAASSLYAIAAPRSRIGLYQFHAVNRRINSGNWRVRGAPQNLPRRPGRQDWRNAPQECAGTDVRRP